MLAPQSFGPSMARRERWEGRLRGSVREAGHGAIVRQRGGWACLRSPRKLQGACYAQRGCRAALGSVCRSSESQVRTRIPRCARLHRPRAAALRLCCIILEH